MNDAELLEWMISIKIVDSTTGCWIWPMAKNSAGYGRVGYRNKNTSVSRLMYALFYNGISPDVVMHKCDNPPCYNPLHLMAGDTAANMKDMVEKRRHERHKRNTCRRGHSDFIVKSDGKRSCLTCSRDSSLIRSARSNEKKRLAKQEAGTYRPRTRLTEEIVLAIRELRTQGIPYLEIARQYNFPVTTLRSAGNGQNWKHVSAGANNES